MSKNENHRLTSLVILWTLFSLLGALLLPATSDAQTEFDRFRLVLKSGERADGRSGEIANGVMTATNTDGEAIEVSLSNIRVLEIQTGSKTGTGFALGALGGALLLLAAVLQAEADENAEVDGSKVVPVGAVLILGGGAIGALIGSRSSSWQEVGLDDLESHATFPIRCGVAYSFAF